MGKPLKLRVVTLKSTNEKPNKNIPVSVLFKEKLKNNLELIIIEYEVYQQSQNIGITLEFDNKYKTGFGIPKLIFGKDDYINGDIPILDNIEVYLEREGNQCSLPYGMEKIENIDFTKIEAQPKIWRTPFINVRVNRRNGVYGVEPAFI